VVEKCYRCGNDVAKGDIFYIRCDMYNPTQEWSDNDYCYLCLECA